MAIHCGLSNFWAKQPCNRLGILKQAHPEWSNAICQWFFSHLEVFQQHTSGFFSRNVWAAFSGWLHWLSAHFVPSGDARLCHKGARATFHKDDVNEANLDLGEPGGLLKIRTCLTPGEEFTCWFTMVYLLSFALLIGRYFCHKLLTPLLSAKHQYADVPARSPFWRLIWQIWFMIFQFFPFQ